MALPKLRSIEVVSPVGGDDIVFERMSGGETMGRLFEFDVDLLSTKGDLPIADAVGKRMTVALSMGLAPPRFFNGVVSRFSLIDWTGDSFRYRARLRPWLWMLSRASNSRIFQGQTIVDVLAAVFEEHGFSGDVDDSALEMGNYKPRDYLVQYQETDFNFVSRLMELSGIHYHFKHELGKHVLVLGDGPSGDKVPGYEVIPYFSGDSRNIGNQDHQHIASWSVGLQVEPGAFASKGFDFENPRAPLLSALSADAPGSDRKLEMFEYPGVHIPSADRDAYVRRRLEEQQQPFEQVSGTGNARGITPGACFKLMDYPGETHNREYLVTAASYTLASNEYSSGAGDSDADFRCTFYAIDAKRTYRTPVTTPRPVVGGPQTAIVVGKTGEEIWTDKYGRVKVQFHWDRDGKHDETSSCWVRVAQVWAGAKWGAMHVPRIGQEVIVDFLEGDPDRPIVTGRVYNGDNMPPYALPDNKTQSGIVSRSTQGGSPDNFNELRFEDKKGSEELFIQAEKNQTTKVKNNQSISVAADRSVSVGGNESISVTGTRTSVITKKETQTFKDAREMKVTAADDVEITGQHTGTYHGGRTKTVEKGDHLTVSSSDKTADVDGKYDITAKTEFQVIQAGINKILVKDEILLDNAQCQVDLKGGDVTIQAAASITLSCGGASIKLNKDGTIEITGSTSVKIDGGGSGVQLAASGATLSGVKATVSGAAMTEITGGLVKIN